MFPVLFLFKMADLLCTFKFKSDDASGRYRKGNINTPGFTCENICKIEIQLGTQYSSKNRTFITAIPL